MITKRLAQARGHAQHGWLDSWHSFSFADYHDPNHINFGSLRVINEDRIIAGSGFPEHAHRDMEIVSYVLHGALAHRDSIGNSAVMRPGDVQRMSAGSGVTHSEYNAAENAQTHFLQIWIIPDTKNLAPSYEQKYFADEEKRGRLCCIASSDAREGSVTIHQDAALYAGLFDGSENAMYSITTQRLIYMHVVRGEVRVNEQQLTAGDALLFESESVVSISHGIQAEILLFDLVALPKI